MKHNTTALPAALREELGLGPQQRRPHPNAARGGRGRGRGGLSVIGRGASAAAGARRGDPLRAEQREQARQEAKRRAMEQNRREREEAARAAAPPAPKAATARAAPPQAEERKRKRAAEPLEPERKPKPAKASVASFATGQRKHVEATHQTPLERLLARSGGSSSAAGPSSRQLSTEEEDAANERKRRALLTKAEREEEDEIRWLESKVGKKDKAEKSKGKGKKKDEDEEGIDGGDDGLDDFIEDLDRFYPGMFSDTEDEGSEGSDGQSESDDPASDAEMSDVEFPAEDEDQVLASDDSDDDADLADWDAAMASTDESEEDDSAEDDASEPSSSGRASENTARSNPAASASVAATAPPSAPTGRYVPPAARAAAAAAAAASGDVEAVQTAAQQRLRRQAKGLLNRLGDGNIESILGELEALYRDNSRAEVTGALTSLILGTVGARSDLVDTFIILYAALIGALHRVVGVEFAASLLQACVDELLKQHAASLALDEADGESTSKEATNLVALLSAMYNLGVLATPLMYDLMRLFLGVESAGSSPAQMREADVELLLKLVKSCGAQLRHDDPTSLRTIIDAAKERANAAKAAVQTGAAEAGSSRTRFMLEALADLKNNRVKATAAAESSPAGQAISRMKKFLAGLGKKRTLRAHEPLRVGLRDLREAETRGKWWLVGAAWAGHGDADDAEGVTAARPLRSKEDDGAQQALLAAARAQGMNTEARRNIFVVLMSSEDYADASNRLLSLKLNDTQRREIVRVLLHCVGGEATYNPYYSLIGAQLSADSTGTRITMQFCLWDFLRTLGERQVGGRSIVEREEDVSDAEEPDADTERKAANIARAYGWWFAKGSLSLNALKTVNFVTLKPAGISFLRLLLVHTLLSTQVSSPAATLRPRALAAATGERAPIEALLVRGTAGNVELTKGLLLFLERDMGARDLRRVVGGKKADVGIVRRLEWAVRVAKDCVAVGATVRPF